MTLTGVLFGEHEVKLHPDTLKYGGSWSGGVRDDGALLAWESNLIRIVYETIAEADYLRPVLLDVGANTGSFALLPAVLPTLRVYAFEPVPSIYATLVENIESNDLTHVFPFALALMDNDGLAPIHVPTQTTQSGLTTLGDRPLRYTAWKDEDVTVMRLDTFWWRRPDGYRFHFVKIDTEGAELYVLHGGEGVIREFKPRMWLEYDNRNTAQFGYERDEIRELLTAWGAETEVISQDGLFAWWK